MYKSIMLILALGWSVSCLAQKKEEGANLSPEIFKEKMADKQKVVVIDVRTPGEVKEGYIEGARFLDFNAPDFNQKVSALDKTKTYLVYCAVGGRSGKTLNLMKGQGFKVHHLEGGFTAWKSKGYPIKK